MSKKILLTALAALTLAALPALSAHASIRPHSATLGGITFPTGTNGCTGPLVGAYGSSALKSYILAAAATYCNTFSNKSTAPDVEYAAGGDSCPGDQFAANNGDANEVGLSDVFPGGCQGTLAVNSATISDTEITVNMVDAISECPGATDLQGGSPHPPTPDTQCTGAGSGAASSLTYCGPSSQSVPIAVGLWSTAINNYAPTGNACGPAFIQLRVPGSGTRATWCYNVFGPGNDSCTGSSAQAPAATTGVMLSDVCGNPYSSPPAPALDAAGTLGYSSRAAVVVDPRQPSGGLLPIQGCGVVPFGGQTAYNGTCDPTNAASQTSSNSTVDTHSPTGRICNGDNQVSTGSYQVWGYEHVVLNHAASQNGNNAAAQTFLQYLQQAPQSTSLVQQQGFMEVCQMNFSRSVDAGPYAAATQSC